MFSNIRAWPTTKRAEEDVVQGRTLVERVSLVVFIAALAAVVLVFLSRNTSSGAQPAVKSEPTKVSESLGARTQPRRAAPTPTVVATSTPTKAEILVAADQIRKARSWFEQTALEPTLAEILVAADQVQRARDFYERVAPQPTMEEVLVAADLLQRFTDYIEAAAVEVTPIPTSTIVPPRPTDTPAPPPPPPATSTPVPPPLPATATQQPIENIGNGWYDTAFEAQVLAIVNEKRAAEGMGPLEYEPRLTQSAKDYAKVLADHNHFSHTGPDGSDLVSRVEDAGFPFTVQIGEVLAWGSDGWPPADIVQAWLDSPGHREQIMGAVYGRAGVGCYFTTEGTLMVRCVMNLAE
jgi:uncharacterized protein YkwD